jgi:hypothetical protein
MNQLTRIPLMADRIGLDLVALADEQIRIHGFVILGEAQAETFQRARPHLSREEMKKPGLFRLLPARTYG